MMAPNIIPQQAQEEAQNKMRSELIYWNKNTQKEYRQ